MVYHARAVYVLLLPRLARPERGARVVYLREVDRHVRLLEKIGGRPARYTRDI